MFRALLSLATFIGASTPATATMDDLVFDLTKADYTAKDLDNLGQCIMQKSQGSSKVLESSMKTASSWRWPNRKPQCPDKVQDVESGLAFDGYLFPRPEITMCYRLKNQNLGSFGDTYTVTDSVDIGTPGAYLTFATNPSTCEAEPADAHCEAGFAAKFQTRFDIVPRIRAHVSTSYQRPLDATMRLDAKITASLTTGVSVLAGGNCNEKKIVTYFPKIPKPVASFCYLTACAVVFVQGRMEFNMEGDFLAGATTVHQINFGGLGKIEIDMKKKKAQSSSPLDFKFDTPTSAWRTEAFGEMNGKIGLKMGPVVSVMFTPGIGSLWASAMPWVQVEASMYGAMKYENRGGDFEISDALFQAHTVDESKMQCFAQSSRPSKDGYDQPLLPSDVQGSNGHEAFRQEAAGSDSCLAAAITLRTGAEIEIGWLPRGVRNKDELKAVVKEHLCGIKNEANTLSASSESTTSVFEDGFMQVIEPATIATAEEETADSDVSECFKLPAENKEPAKRRLFVGNLFKNMCSFTVDQLFSPIPDAVVNPLYKAERTQGCRDFFKFYTSKQCMNRVGCPATTTTTTTTTTTAPTIAVGDVRAQNGERVQAGQAFIPEVYYDGKYSPICGHHFWDDNQGAKNVCKRLGLGGGKVERTNHMYHADAMPVGRCKEGESLDKCSAGGNAFGDFSKTYGWVGEDSCRKGQRIGVNVVCDEYDPCKGAHEGSNCRACPPGLKGCTETAVLKTCQRGKCRPSGGSSGIIKLIKPKTRNLRQRLRNR